MHTQRIPDGFEEPSQQDRAILLDHLLAHGRPLAEYELAREVSVPGDVSIALKRLRTARLVHRWNDLVTPSLAAVRFIEVMRRSALSFARRGRAIPLHPLSPPARGALSALAAGLGGKHRRAGQRAPGRCASAAGRAGRWRRRVCAAREQLAPREAPWPTVAQQAPATERRRVRVDELARDPEQDGCLRGSEQLGCAQIGRVGLVEQRVEVVLAGLHNRQLVVTASAVPPDRRGFADNNAGEGALSLPSAYEPSEEYAHLQVLLSMGAAGFEPATSRV
jgi:hypothetical protein